MAATTQALIIAARKHRDDGAMPSSARQCLVDAVALWDAGEYDLARVRALKSLAYSVGMFSPVYRRFAEVSHV